jgi:hypothetical protein
MKLKRKWKMEIGLLVTKYATAHLRQELGNEGA